ncbi:hypothetical protein FOL47_009945 [Perkinsus chesapeaki]|uniref:RING-type domain-containing protein n=1 Tax=Perkinsus chesapeaki TaxID=330153 RepID=A0A7J6MQY0_PERCH|nr:hypothetical protein FOL47_009945 [Perkinsus chesapeaki]
MVNHRPTWDMREREARSAPVQRPALRSLASTWALILVAMFMLAWSVDAVLRNTTTVSVDREALNALQVAIFDVVKDQKDLGSRVDDQYFDLLDRINDISTSVRRMSHTPREPLPPVIDRIRQHLVEVDKVSGTLGSGVVIVFGVVSAVLAAVVHFTVLRTVAPEGHEELEKEVVDDDYDYDDYDDDDRHEQATLHYRPNRPPPAYNPDVVPIASLRDTPVLPYIPAARKAIIDSPKVEPKQQQQRRRQLSACVVCMASRSTHAIVPCGHRCCCGVCHVRLKRCPLCTVKISSAIKVYD